MDLMTHYLSQKQYVEMMLSKLRMNEALRWVLRYLRGTSSTSIHYDNDKDKIVLQGLVDVDLSGDVDSSKNTSRYIYTIDGIAVS